MNELLKSIKADLLDRRLLPIVALVVLALVGAVGYAVLGGGSNTPTGGAAVAGVRPHGTPGIVVTPAQLSTTQAVAETTNGSAAQRGGSAHDPFTLLPAAKAAATALNSAKGAAGAGGSPSSAGAGKSSTSTPSSGTSTPATTTPAPETPKPAKPAKPKTVYAVSIQFGALPVTPGSQLQSYPSLIKPTPLPSAKEKIVELVGVTIIAKATSAAFAVGGEVILHGAGVCLPSPAQCKLIALEEGKTEQLEYLLPTGQPIIYELKVVSITSHKASGASVARVFRAQAKAAGRLLAEGGVLRLAGLHYSATAGLLAFDDHSAFGARAGAARRGVRHSG